MHLSFVIGDTEISQYLYASKKLRRLDDKWEEKKQTRSREK